MIALPRPPHEQHGAAAWSSSSSSRSTTTSSSGSTFVSAEPHHALHFPIASLSDFCTYNAELRDPDASRRAAIAAAQTWLSSHGAQLELLRLAREERDRLERHVHASSGAESASTIWSETSESASEASSRRSSSASISSTAPDSR